ncbi:hypothetical protein BaRGS_00017243 [Batillaria attramentaria]|uniref:Uncharacterized protein n=1 Tax=Batillaria attramentaria TaxID=370345 RepID=A0ABD0KW20_9CAEN
MQQMGASCPLPMTEIIAELGASTTDSCQRVPGLMTGHLSVVEVSRVTRCLSRSWEENGEMPTHAHARRGGERGNEGEERGDAVLIVMPASLLSPLIHTLHPLLPLA